MLTAFLCPSHRCSLLFMSDHVSSVRRLSVCTVEEICVAIVKEAKKSTVNCKSAECKIRSTFSRGVGCVINRLVSEPAIIQVKRPSPVNLNPVRFNAYYESLWDSFLLFVIPQSLQSHLI